MVYVYCEGPTDEKAVTHLLRHFVTRNGKQWIDVKIDNLHDAPRFLRNIGNATNAAISLRAKAVFGVLDLYGATDYRGVKSDVSVRAEHLRQLILKDISPRFRGRFHFHPAVHELEAWLLADPGNIASALGSNTGFGPWPNPESVNFNIPPKRVLSDLWRTRHPRKKAYQGYLDGLRLFQSLDPELVYQTCPCFRAFVDDFLSTL